MAYLHLVVAVVVIQVYRRKRAELPAVHHLRRPRNHSNVSRFHQAAWTVDRLLQARGLRQELDAPPRVVSTLWRLRDKCTHVFAADRHAGGRQSVAALMLVRRYSEADVWSPCLNMSSFPLVLRFLAGMRSRTCWSASLLCECAASGHGRFVVLSSYVVLALFTSVLV